jgi:hypothetical protein
MQPNTDGSKHRGGTGAHSLEGPRGDQDGNKG